MMVAKHIKLWWLFNGDNVGGCLQTLGLTSLIVLVAIIILWPFGKIIPATGKLVGFGMRETEEGSYRLAYVVAEGVRGRVRLYPSDCCAVGDDVNVVLVARPWGRSVGRGMATSLCQL